MNSLRRLWNRLIDFFSQPSEETPVRSDLTGKLRVIPKGKECVLYQCGHEGPRDYEIQIFDSILEPQKSLLNERLLCPNCVMTAAQEEIILCALCGRPIFPGDPVAIYVDDAGFRDEWKTKISSTEVVGCLATDCCPSGGFFAGHWNGDDIVTPFKEGNTAAAEAFATGDVIFVNNGQVVRMPREKFLRSDDKTKN